VIVRLRRAATYTHNEGGQRVYGCAESGALATAGGTVMCALRQPPNL